MIFLPRHVPKHLFHARQSFFYFRQILPPALGLSPFCAATSSSSYNPLSMLCHAVLLLVIYLKGFASFSSWAFCRLVKIDRSRPGIFWPLKHRLSLFSIFESIYQPSSLPALDRSRSRGLLSRVGSRFFGVSISLVCFRSRLCYLGGSCRGLGYGLRLLLSLPCLTNS